MEPLNADGPSRTDDEERSLLAESSLEHPGSNPDGSMVMPDINEVAESCSEKSGGEFSGVYIALDDFLPQSNTKESSSPVTDPSASVHVVDAEKVKEEPSVPVDESTPPSSEEDPLRCLASVIPVIRSSLMETDRNCPSAKLHVYIERHDKSIPATDPSASVHVADAEKGKEEPSVPVDESTPPSSEDPLRCQASAVPASGSCVMEMDRNCPSDKLQVHRERHDKSIPATDQHVSVHVADAEKINEEPSIPVDESASPSSKEDPLRCQASVVPVSESCLMETDRNCTSAKLQVYSERHEKSVPATDPSASVHVADAEKGKEEPSVPMDESAPPSSKEDPLRCQESVIPVSGSCLMEADRNGPSHKLQVYRERHDNSIPATDSSASVHVADAGQVKEHSVPVDVSAPPSSEEDPLRCEASIVPVSGSCLMEMDRNCPSAKLQVYRERRDKSIPDSHLVHSEMDILDKGKGTGVDNSNDITDCPLDFPVQEEHVMEVDASIPTEEHPEATSRTPERPVPQTKEDKVGTSLRRSTRRRSLHANRLEEEFEVAISDGETTVSEEEKEQVRKRKKKTEASDWAANKKPRKKRRVNKALQKKDAVPNSKKKKDAVVTRRRARNERMNTCLYIAYNGKWTKNKYIDHETKLILVSDEITFEGLVEGIFHVLNLERNENEANVWFDAKLETSKGMLVTNDEEVTTCIYLLKNDSNFKNSRFIVDIVERNSLSPKSSNTESRSVNDEVNIVQQEEGVGDMDSEGHKGLTVQPLRSVEPAMEPEFLTPKGRSQGTGETSAVKKIRKRSRNKQNDLPIMVLREDASLDEIVEGSLFEDKESLTRCLSKNAIKHNFQFKVKKSSKFKWWLRCYGEGCGWCMRSSKLRDSALFQIKKFVQDHTCFPEEFKSDQRHVTPKLISDHIIELLRDAKVEIKPNFVVEEIKRKYGLNIGYHKAWRSMQKAYGIIRERPDKDRFLLPSNSDSEQGDCSDLPPGWEKEVTIRETDKGIRKRPRYTHPEHDYVFRSKKDILRYLETGDPDSCVSKPARKNYALALLYSSVDSPSDLAASDEDCPLMLE